MPPECWPRWRGSPTTACQSAAKRRIRAIREVGAGAPEVAGRRLLVRILVAPAGDVLGEPVEEVRREAERLPDLADRAPRLVGDDVRGHRGARPAVAPVDVLDDRLAALSRREVEVDVRPLAPLLREKALEEEIHPDRIDGRDPEAVADRAVRRRAPALDEDPARAGFPHDVPDDQEVAGKVELLDEPELAGELLAHARRHGAVSPARAGLDELLEVGDLGPAVGDRVVGEAIAQILEREARSARRSPPWPRRPRAGRQSAGPSPPVAGGAARRSATGAGRGRPAEPGAGWPSGRRGSGARRASRGAHRRWRRWAAGPRARGPRRGGSRARSRACRAAGAPRRPGPGRSSGRAARASPGPPPGAPPGDRG